MLLETIAVIWGPFTPCLLILESSLPGKGNMHLLGQSSALVLCIVAQTCFSISQWGLVSRGGKRGCCEIALSPMNV